MLFKVIIMPLKKALQDIWNLRSRYLGGHFDFRDKQCGQQCNGVIMLNNHVSFFFLSNCFLFRVKKIGQI